MSSFLLLSSVLGQCCSDLDLAYTSTLVMHCYGPQAWCQHDYLGVFGPSLQLPAAAGRSACSACMQTLKMMWHSFLYLLPFLGVSAAEHCLEERDNGVIQVRRSKRVEALQVGTVAPSLGHHQDSTVVRSALLLRKLSAHPTTPSSVWHTHRSQQPRTSF